MVAYWCQWDESIHRRAVSDGNCEETKSKAILVKKTHALNSRNRWTLFSRTIYHDIQSPRLQTCGSFTSKSRGGRIISHQTPTWERFDLFQVQILAKKRTYNWWVYDPFYRQTLSQAVHALETNQVWLQCFSFVRGGIWLCAKLGALHGRRHWWRKHSPTNCHAFDWGLWGRGAFRLYGPFLHSS